MLKLSDETKLLIAVFVLVGALIVAVIASEWRVRSLYKGQCEVSLNLADDKRDTLLIQLAQPDCRELD